MAISTALNTALSGLNVATKRTDIIAGNLANSLTPGYARRELDVTSSTLSGVGIGVQINGVIRHTNPALLADRRIAEAEFSSANTKAGFYANFERILGTPEEGHSLSNQVAQFETALISASSRPDSDLRLKEVLRSAQSLVSTLNSASSSIQESRERADSSIATQVDSLNSKLAQIAELNRAVVQSRSKGNDPSALMDQRQLITDEVSTIIPVRETTRDNGQIALYTPGGAILVDGPAATFDFSASATIVPEMTQDSGGLSGLTINGRPIDTGNSEGPIGGGSLAALFQVRDEFSVQSQASLDAFSRDLIERYEAVADPGDPNSGLAGLFTDGGDVFDPALEVGLSERLSINSLADPDTGGELYRIRDGLTATSAGSVSDTANLQAWHVALSDSRTPSSGAFSGAARTLTGLASDVLSSAGSSRQIAEAELSFRSVQYAALRQSELSLGVNSDEELQMLLVVEKAYAANVKVIQTVDDMLQTLLRI